MPVSTKIIAPEGYGPLKKGQSYYLLKHDSRRERVLLVFFSGWDMDKPKAALVVLNQGFFEQGLQSHAIQPSDDSLALPPWLERHNGIDLDLYDLRRRQAKQSHKARIEQRLTHISEALQDAEAILAAEDPIRSLNSYARKCMPIQNEPRFRLWFLTYITFGRNAWVLMPPFCRIGHWDREKHPNTKFGAPSKAYGKRYGYPSTPEMVEMMSTGYLKFSGLGQTLVSIYRKTMSKIFGCNTTKGKSGMLTYSHPGGKPFPSYEQFRYRIHQVFGIEVVQKTLYGNTRFRNRLAPSEGSYTQEVANLLERIEADAYYTKERPRGFIEGTPLPSLCVVVGRDALSGLKVGIGFAFGKERSSAYRMMLFSMAVGKKFFCKLFGIDIDEEEWPSKGLSPYLRIDRGPGSKQDLIKEIEQRFPIKDMVPSWSGQSKAVVESSHPKDIKLEGEPTYIHSDLTPVQLAIREILGLLKFNHTADMSGRIQPSYDMADVVPSPIGLWNHYERRMRTDAQPMPLEEAVRTFLTPTEFTVHEDGVWLQGQRYDSAQLRATGILRRVAQSDAIKINGYTLDLCVRHIWVEVDNRLLILDAQLKIREDEDTLYYSVAELAQWDEHRSRVNSAFRVHQHAAHLEYTYRFEEDTGKEWNAGKRKTGRPRKDQINLQETKEAGQQTAQRRVA